MKTLRRRAELRRRRRRLAVALLAAIGWGGQSIAQAENHYLQSHTGQLVSAPLQDCCPPQPVCPPGWTGTVEEGAAMSEGPDGQAIQPEASTPLPSSSDFMAPSPQATPASFASGSRGGLNAPGMIGDFIGPQFNPDPAFIGPPLTVQSVLFGGERRFKIAENVSPIPQDRFIFNYNHYHNAARDPAGNDINIDRFTFGFEKTFMNGLASYEFRLPFSSTLDSTLVTGAAGQQSTELGNIKMALKANLMSGPDYILAGGTTFTMPTGDDLTVVDGGGATQLTIDNESYHLAPFLGLLATPSRDWFYQGYVQVDFDLNGNGVTQGGNTGQLQDQSLLFLDGSLGRWLYRANNRGAHLRAVAAMMELHYTSTMQDADTAAGITNSANRVDILNLTSGLNFQIGQANLRVGGVAPLRENADKPFDAEFFVQFNRFF